MKLNNDSVFIYPTDTVWGIGASIYSEAAFKKIAAIKKTTEDKPLSIMFTDINTLHSSFNFPDFMTTSWLRGFFKLESTLGVPLKSARIPIPSWVTAKSPFVSIRFSEDDTLKGISKEIKGPFFTTSLNITQSPPIINFNEALEFKKLHAPETEIFGNSTHNLSGRSSTIVFYKVDSFEVIREGLKVSEIKKYLNSTGVKVS